MDSTVQAIARLTGWSCIAIGAGHIALGVRRSVPGSGPVSPTLESQEAFYNAVFIGYGVSWLRATQEQSGAHLVEPSAIMGLGGVARVIAMARRGRPHPLYVALTALEFGLPAAVAVLARRNRTTRSRP